MKFTVRTSKWLRDRTADFVGKRGYKYKGGKLLSGNGMKCCLGFCALQLGAKTSEISGKGMPNDLFVTLEPLAADFDGFRRNTRLSSEAATINDDPSTTSDRKMELLEELFKSYGHEIVFED